MSTLPSSVLSTTLKQCFGWLELFTSLIFIEYNQNRCAFAYSHTSDDLEAMEEEIETIMGVLKLGSLNEQIEYLTGVTTIN